jgi:hypothetical protein
MKTIAFMLLLAAGAADPCVCGGCAGFAHRERPGTCATCKGQSSSIDDTLCESCARKGSACPHCGKGLRDPQILVGEASLVDKQPRAELTYFVCKGEDGKPQGVHVDRKRFPSVEIKGRALLFMARDGKGDVVVREWLALAPKEKDLEVKGESDRPVSRRALLSGLDSSPKDGKFSLVLPAVPGWTFDVMLGDKILSRHCFADGAWKQVK